MPRHELLSAEDKAELLEQYHLKEEQLPRIKSSDPVAKYYGLVKGNVRFSFSHLVDCTAPNLTYPHRGRWLRSPGPVRPRAATSRTAWSSNLVFFPLRNLS